MYLNYFLYIEFQPMTSASDDCTLYYQTKTLINFWYSRKLNPKFFIQPLETLKIKLTKPTLCI